MQNRRFRSVKSIARLPKAKHGKRHGLAITFYRVIITITFIAFLTQNIAWAYPTDTLAPPAGLVTKEEAIYIRRAAVQMSSEELKVPTPKTMGILGYNAKMKQKPMKDLWDENGYKGVINAYIGTRDTDGYFIVLDDKIVYNYQPPQKKGAPVKSVKSGYADYPEARIYLEKLMREGLTNLNRVIYLKGGTDKRSKQQTKEWFAMAFKSKKFKHIKYFSSL